MTQRAPSNKYPFSTFRKHNVMTMFVILKSGTAYTRVGGGGGRFSFVVLRFFFCLFSFFFFFGSKWLNAGWFLVNSYYKRLCASLCTFETVQEIKKK